MAHSRVPAEGFSMWSTGSLNFEFCKIIESISKLCGPENVNSKISMSNTGVRTVSLFFLLLRHPGGRHNVASSKIKASWPAKSRL